MIYPAEIPVSINIGNCLIEKQASRSVKSKTIESKRFANATISRHRRPLGGLNMSRNQISVRLSLAPNMQPSRS
jgi:hypothetical protein